MRLIGTILHTLDHISAVTGITPGGTVIWPTLCILLLVGSSASTAGARTLLRQETSLQQSFDLHVPVPPTPVPMADTLRLVYELHLTNFAREPLVLQQVEVLDVEGATVIAEVRGAALDRRLYRPGIAPTDDEPRTIAPGMHGVLYLEPALDGGVPSLLEHRVTHHVAGQAAQTPSVVRGARIQVETEPPVMIGPPLEGGPWVAIHHPSWDRGHRRVVYAVAERARIPARFAIDWVLLDADGRRARGDQDTISNWHGYGADVLAVADGVVAAMRDDVAESATLSDHPNHPLEDATGNYVALDLGDGRYAFYEHLQPGSTRGRLPPKHRCRS